MQLHALRYSDGRWEDDLPDLGDRQLLGFAFGATEYVDDQAPFEQLRSRYPALALAGCSSSGEILGTEVADGTLSVVLAEFASTTFRFASTQVSSAEESTAVGSSLASELVADGLKGITVFSDGLGVNGTDLARGMIDSLPEGVIVSGGLAGDADRFERTWVIVDGKPQTGQVSAVGFYGDDIEFAYGSEGGWGPFGPSRRVTRAEGAVLYELDGRPALELYKEYLGERASGLPATALLFPLQITDADGRSVVRTILGVDEATQSMTFAGDITEGAEAQLMRASFEGLIDGAEDAAEQAQVDDPALCLAISCVGRRLVMGEEVEEEVEATASTLPTGSEQIGFYSYGELAPTGHASCDLHNQTMTLTTIIERTA